MYYYPPNAHRVTIGSQKISVDSALEETVIRRLEASGFHDKWVKPHIGLQVGSYRYTPDIELAVMSRGRTIRALVEVKPTRAHFTTEIASRMIGVASFYPIVELYLYTDRGSQWYSVDVRSGAAIICKRPMPGNVSIAQLKRPLSITSSRAYHHHYHKRFVLWKSMLNFLNDLFLDLLTGTPKSRRRRIG
jgi:hypothetical protein